MSVSTDKALFTGKEFKVANGICKVVLLGNLGKDPEVRFMPSGDPVANIVLATSDTWKDKSTGEPKEKTEWHRVVMFGKLAEIASKYLKKGSKVYIEGKIQTRKWTNQQGQDQYTTEVVLQGYNGVLQMLDSKAKNESTNATRPTENYPHQQQCGLQQTNNKLKVKPAIVFDM